MTLSSKQRVFNKSYTKQQSKISVFRAWIKTSLIKKDNEAHITSDSRATT